MQATSLPSTVAKSKSTICCKVARTVGAENSVRAMPANELASSPYGSSTVFTSSLPFSLAASLARLPTWWNNPYRRQSDARQPAGEHTDARDGAGPDRHNGDAI